MPFGLALCGVVAILVGMLVGPSLSLANYDWVQHTLSELGGQSMPGAFVMNLGFAGYGLGCILASIMAFKSRKLTHSAIIVFGSGLIGASLFSALPIDARLPSSLLEDRIHSFFASLIGFAFAVATASALFGSMGRPRDGLSWIALVSTVAIPLAMVNFPAVEGALQRIMFAISFLWVCRHFWQVSRPEPKS